jgi:hypothetical protein
VRWPQSDPTHVVIHGAVTSGPPLRLVADRVPLRASCRPARLITSHPIETMTDGVRNSSYALGEVLARRADRKPQKCTDNDGNQLQD